MRYMLRRLWVLVLAGVLLAGGTAPALAADPGGNTLRILFTHDTHDHWLPGAAEDGEAYGGYTRLATLIRQQREALEERPDAQAMVVLDGGDFSMGSLFQSIYAAEAPELRALGAMGYDAVTLGNHEFDYRAEGLASMLEAALASGDPLPAVVEANYTPSQDDTVSRAAWEAYGVTDYTVIRRGTAADGEPMAIAVFGVMGEDAHAAAPMSGMEFEPVADAARRVVEEIREKEDVEFIICLSHSGTTDGKGEDYALAKAVDGIDVIISGHTHTTLEEPIRVNDTLIVSGGPYTEHLGRLTVEKGADGLAVVDYTLIPVDESVPEDTEMAEIAAAFQTQVDGEYLADFGLTFNQVLAESPYSFTPISALGEVQEEDALGNLIADSYRWAVQQAEGEDYIPVDFAVTASGVIRASLGAGEITTSDAFDVLSLGSGADGTPGYPLVAAYLTGRDLKDLFEVDASVTPLMPAAQLYGAGMTWTFNPHRMIFNKVVSCAQVLEDGTAVPLEDDRLYRVVTGLYSAQMLGAVEEKSFGLLSVTPRDSTGAPVENMEDFIIRTPDGAELKEWYALASYLSAMETVDGRYAGPEGRKVVVDARTPAALLRNPNWLTLLALAVVLVILAAVVLLVLRLTGRLGKRRRYGSRRGRNGHYRHYRG